MSELTWSSHSVLATVVIDTRLIPTVSIVYQCFIFLYNYYLMLMLYNLMMNDDVDEFLYFFDILMDIASKIFGVINWRST